MINSMSYKGYTASMVFDAEDKVIVGRVQDIDDIISFHGESVSEFESNFHAAIEDYLAASRELGSAPEKPASGKVMLRIAPEIHAAALKAAARSGTSLNKWAEGALGKAARKPPCAGYGAQRSLIGQPGVSGLASGQYAPRLHQLLRSHCCGSWCAGGNRRSRRRVGRLVPCGGRLECPSKAESRNAQLSRLP